MRLTHGRVSLELHELAQRTGVALLLLHAQCGSSQDWGEAPAAWPGPVHALDFCGHGRSDWLAGAGYSPELLLADADAALAHIGRAALAGAGLGAYIALLLAGARPDVVPAALLLPGAGLEGGGALPDFTRALPSWLISDGSPGAASTAPSEPEHDPMVRNLDLYVRPVDYVEAFAGAARRLVFVEDDQPRPPWWQAAQQAAGAESLPLDLRGALSRLAEITGSDA